MRENNSWGGGPGFSSRGDSHFHEFYLKELDDGLIVKIGE